MVTVAMAPRAKQMGLPEIEHNHVVTTIKPRHTAAKSLVINPKWKISSDELQFTISRFVGGRWRSEAYVMTLEAAYNWLVNQEIRDSDLADLKDAVNRVGALRRDILRLAAVG